jgi:hypothetical protein
MVETQATEPGQPFPEQPRPAEPPPRRSGGKRILWVLILVILAFLAGFGWQYYNAQAIEARLEQTVQELAVERLRVGLAQAAVAAQSGDFEGARRQMSDFFTAMQARLDQLPPDVRAVGEELLRTRDDVITGLSRANPESAELLYGMLLRFRTSLGDPPAQAVPTQDPMEADSGPAAEG